MQEFAVKMSERLEVTGAGSDAKYSFVAGSGVAARTATPTIHCLKRAHCDLVLAMVSQPNGSGAHQQLRGRSGRLGAGAC
jgi:hypothetical protein